MGTLGVIILGVYLALPLQYNTVQFNTLYWSMAAKGTIKL